MIVMLILPNFDYITNADYVLLFSPTSYDVAELIPQKTIDVATGGMLKQIMLGYAYKYFK